MPCESKLYCKFVMPLYRSFPTRNMKSQSTSYSHFVTIAQYLLRTRKNPASEPLREQRKKERKKKCKQNTKSPSNMNLWSTSTNVTVPQCLTFLLHIFHSNLDLWIAWLFLGLQIHRDSKFSNFELGFAQCFCLHLPLPKMDLKIWVT